MADDQSFTDQELAIIVELVEEALDDPRPTLSAEEMDASIQALYERTIAERRKLA